MRDSNYCYWHHKARARRRRNDHIGGPISMEGNSGLDLPVLEDANAVQVSIQEIMQAILDRRIDNKRAGLLIYSLQLASSNIRNLSPRPMHGDPYISRIGGDDEEVFNDTLKPDDRDETSDPSRNGQNRHSRAIPSPQSPRTPPKKPAKPASVPA